MSIRRDTATLLSAIIRDRPLIIVFVVGLLIRLALLPIATHQDLFSIYSRAAEAAFDGNWSIWGSQFLIQTIHNLWLLLMSPFLPNARDIWSDTAGVIGVGIQGHEYQAFLDYEYLPRLLVLLKFPYVVADMLVALVLVMLVRPAERTWAAGIWLLNPLVIYTSVLFGRHDSIAVLLVVGSILAARYGRTYIGLLLLGLGAAARFFPVLLAPFFVVAYRRSTRQMLVLIASLLGLLLIVEIGAQQITGSSPIYTVITRYPHINYLVELGVPLYSFPFGQSLMLVLFPMAYAFLFLWYADSTRSPMPGFTVMAGAVFSLFFALTFFHPQYAIWLVPFLAIGIARYPRLLPLHIVQILLLGVHSLQWGSATTTELFLPLGDEFVASLPDPRGVVGGIFPLEPFFSVTRSVFAAVTLWLGYRLIKLGRVEPVIAEGAVSGRP